MQDNIGKSKIKHALAELLEEKDFDKITIQDIVRRAGVSRTTYYYHYYEQQEVLDDLFQDIFQHMSTALVIKSYSYEMLQKDSLKAASFVIDNRALIHALLFGSAKELFKERYHKFFIDVYNNNKNNDFSETYNAMRADFLFAGYYQLLQIWFQTEITETIDDYVDIRTSFGMQELNLELRNTQSEMPASNL